MFLLNNTSEGILYSTTARVFAIM